MSKFSLLLIFVMFFINFPINAQEWVRTLTDGNYAYPRWVIETYDKGYLMLINSTDINSMSIYLWLVKTDINGNKLWEKRIGTGQDAISFSNVEETLDHGYILAGSFSKYGGPYFDPAIIKLNSCGELDWCNVIKTQGITIDFATRVKPILTEVNPSGGL